MEMTESMPRYGKKKHKVQKARGRGPRKECSRSQRGGRRILILLDEKG